MASRANSLDSTNSSVVDESVGDDEDDDEDDDAEADDGVDDGAERDPTPSPIEGVARASITPPFHSTACFMPSPFLQ